MGEYKVKTFESYLDLERYLNTFVKGNQIITITSNTVGYNTNYTLVYKW